MNDIQIRPYSPNDYVSVRRNMQEGGLYYPEIDAEQKLNKKIKVEGILTTKGYREVYCLVKDNDTELKEYYKKRGFKEGDIPYRVMLKEIERR